MPDITKCEGTDCPLKENCYRFTATDSEFRQSYFETPPIKDGKCNYFWKNTENKNKKNNMEKEFIKYEQALALKELGFSEPCFKKYIAGCLWSSPIKKEVYEYIHPNNSDCLAPIYQQAFRWFREKYGLFGCIDLQSCTPSHWYIRIDKIEINDYLYHSEDEPLRFNTYEEAELACLDKLIELIKKNNYYEKI